jgi:hypothetical protein
LGYGAVHDYLAEGQHQRRSSGSTLSVIRRLTELLTLDRSNARTRGKTQIARKAFINVYIVVDCDLQVTAGHPSEPQIGVVVRAARSESTARGEIVLDAFLESSIILTAERVEIERGGKISGIIQASGERAIPNAVRTAAAKALAMNGHGRRSARARAHPEPETEEKEPAAAQDRNIPGI